LDGQGGAQVFADYWQWEQTRSEARPRAARETAETRPASQPAAGKKKLSYIEAREMEGMEQRILEAEQEVEALRARMQAPDVVSDGPKLQETYGLLQAAEAKVDELYARWAELEAKRG
jgi:ATP-binding cassette subfamily F protein uup